ncbi:MAG: hypothetical protein CMJ46_07780 [Planctomyces sp.]|nr:hypothetical protein [Planctomyces sp.]
MKKLVYFVALTVLFAGMNEAFARGGRGGGGRGGAGRVGGGNIGGGNRGGANLSSRNVSPGGSSRKSPADFNRPSPGNFGSGGQGNFNRATNPSSGSLPSQAQSFQRPNGSSIRSNTNAAPKSGDLQNFLNLPATGSAAKGSQLSNSIQSRSPFEQGAAFGDRSGKFSEKTGQQPGELFQSKSEAFQGKADQIKNSEQFQAKSEQFQNKNSDFQTNFESTKAEKQEAWDGKKSEWSETKDQVAEQVRNEYNDLTQELEDQPLHEDLHDAYHDYYDDWAYMYEQYPGYFWLQAAQWGAIGGWVLNEAVSDPYAYNYGTSVYTDASTVYYEGEPVATTEEYAEEAYEIAAARPEAAPENIQWMPLGMYVVKASADANDRVIIQLSVSQEGYLIGTYYDEKSESAIPLEGTVDKSTQRTAWKLSNDVSPMVMETGIYDLTLDQTVVMVHFGTERTEQWLLVRLNNTEATAATNIETAE